MAEKDTFSRQEIKDMLNSALHNANGFISIWAAAEGPKAVRLAEQVKDAFVQDIDRLLRGVPTLHDHIRMHLTLDHGCMPICGNSPKCKNAANCKDCQIYEEYKNKLRENFRD